MQIYRCVLQFHREATLPPGDRAAEGAASGGGEDDAALAAALQAEEDTAAAAAATTTTTATAAPMAVEGAAEGAAPAATEEEEEPDAGPGRRTRGRGKAKAAAAKAPKAAPAKAAPKAEQDEGEGEGEDDDQEAPADADGDVERIMLTAEQHLRTQCPAPHLASLELTGVGSADLLRLDMPRLRRLLVAGNHRHGHCLAGMDGLTGCACLPGWLTMSAWAGRGGAEQLDTDTLLTWTPMEALEELVLDSNPEALYPKFLKALCIAAPNLKILKYGWKYRQLRLYDKDLLMLARGMPRLEALELCGIHRVTASGVADCLLAASHLRRVVLYDAEIKSTQALLAHPVLKPFEDLVDLRVEPMDAWSPAFETASPVRQAAEGPAGKQHTHQQFLRKMAKVAAAAGGPAAPAAAPDKHASQRDARFLKRQQRRSRFQTAQYEMQMVAEHRERGCAHSLLSTTRHLPGLRGFLLDPAHNQRPYPRIVSAQLESQQSQYPGMVYYGWRGASTAGDWVSSLEDATCPMMAGGTMSWQGSTPMVEPLHEVFVGGDAAEAAQLALGAASASASASALEAAGGPPRPTLGRRSLSSVTGLLPAAGGAAGPEEGDALVGGEFDSALVREDIVPFTFDF
ncbi:hypothetical protein PAPYR_3497 [Paratrimastix pyriformis]|uniref:Uncharacterized protein n=1 Tax=Paratrimastix pyriformis TaxID=342808 RepID=A0ABQ8UMQ0_9EUKA|nr:hypothetical protein PAPYR_3497 [Paratrimastix pyriformis]